ncbi:hypothetical protein D3C85_1320370 [compost metagenome]
MILIGQQPEVQAVAFLEFFQALGRIRADTEHHHVEGGQLCIDVAQAAGLGGAARGHRLGIEIDEHLLAPQGGQTDLLTILIGEGKIGGLSTNL